MTTTPESIASTSTSRTSKTTYFVALDPSGRPICQRTTLRGKPYLSATPHGSFSASPPNGKHPCKVIEVEKPVEWIARATLPDGTKVSQRSRSGPPGRNYILYAYASKGLPGLREEVAWSNETADAFLSRDRRRSSLMSYELVMFAAGTVEVRNWPTAGDSIVLPDAVRP